jgi:hypothetical protein
MISDSDSISKTKTQRRKHKNENKFFVRKTTTASTKYRKDMPHSVYSTVLKIKKNAPKARCENQPFVSTFTVVNRHELNSTKSNILHSRLNDKHLLSSPSKHIKIDSYVTASDDENGMSVQSGRSNELPLLETSPTTVPLAVQVALPVPYKAHRRQDEVSDLLTEIEQHDLVMLFHRTT